jgi:lipid-binding SYLF domain-containing protein
MNTRSILKFVQVSGLLLLFAGTPGIASAQTEQQDLVRSAETTFANFMRDPDMIWLQQNIGRAKAVLIAPSIAKAGFIFGGSGGRAVLIARDPQTGQWRGPAFYTLMTATFGFQAGIQVSEMVTLVMTDRGVNSLLSDSFELGADASIAAGPVGAGARSDITADFVAFSRSKGIYGGLNLEGTLVRAGHDWNEAYYQKNSVLPPDILVRGNVHNGQADALVAAVSSAAGRG